jgi:hypothetical protein
MTHMFTLVRGVARLRTLLLVALAPAFGACDADRLANSSGDPSTVIVAEPAGAPAAPSFSSSFRGGIPFGFSDQPSSVFGDRFNGALRNIYPQYLFQHLAEIKARGGKVILNLAGAPARYKDSSGNFSLAMWKASADRFKDVDFSSYIQDGTIIGNYLIDEPNSKNRWGRTVSPVTVEEMANYSKSRWPDLPTIVRVRPGYLGADRGSDRVVGLRSSGRLLPVRLHQLEVRPGIHRAVRYCRGLGIPFGAIGESLHQVLPWIKRPDSRDDGAAAAGSAGTDRTGAAWGMRLTWSGAPGSHIDAYRKGELRKLLESNARNDGKYTHVRGRFQRAATYVFKVCERGTSNCSNEATVTFKK